MHFPQRGTSWFTIAVIALALLAYPKVRHFLHAKQGKTASQQMSPGGDGKSPGGGNQGAGTPGGGSGVGGSGGGPGAGGPSGGGPGGGGGSGAGGGGTGAGGSGGGPGGKYKVQVTAHVVRPKTLQEKVVSTGTLQASEDIQLKSEAAGRIVRLPLHEGNRVPKGTLLVKINDADLQAQLIKAKAALETARTNLVREKRLLARNFISQQEYDLAKEALESARGDVQLLVAQIQKTEVRAPFAGVVGLKLVSLGGFVSVGSPIANFVSDAPLNVVFSVPEQYYDSVSPGKVVDFTVQGADSSYSAKVSAVDPKVDENTRTVNVRAVCDSTDSALAPGSFAHLTLVVRELPEALSVPSQALVPNVSGQQVYVLRQGAAVAQKVQIGLRTDVDVEITAGIRPGDTVITTGVTLIRPGSPVEVKSLN